jgi:hypothetical protein
MKRITGGFDQCWSCSDHFSCHLIFTLLETRKLCSLGCQKTWHHMAWRRTAPFVFLRSEAGFAVLAFFSPLDEKRCPSCSPVACFQSFLL